jgi:hypothetical protein
MSIFRQGARVATPQGTGTIRYARLNPSDLGAAVAYSVALDARIAASEEPPFTPYSGTIIPAGEVRGL